MHIVPWVSLCDPLLNVSAGAASLTAVSQVHNVFPESSALESMRRISGNFSISPRLQQILTILPSERPKRRGSNLSAGSAARHPFTDAQICVATVRRVGQPF